MKLVFELSAPDGGAACAVALRIACLNHELFDDTMEYVAVKVAVSRMYRKVFNRFGNSFVRDKETK